MVKNEIDMITRGKYLLPILCMGLLGGAVDAQDFDVKWKSTRMDGSRTGVVLSAADNVKESMGENRGKKYYAPNGKVYKCGTVPKVAKIMIDAQKDMVAVKQVVAYSPEAMTSHRPESALSDWFVDILIRSCGELTGKKVDVGFANFGGIRVDMPKGDVLLDDIMSMFPFKNKLCYLELKGSDIRVILEQMAREYWQVVGGVRCVSDKNGKLLSAEIGGQPLDDDKVYGVTTVDFLLNGGDGYSIAKNALDVKVLDVYVIDVVLPYVKKLTAEGKPVEYKADGRVQILK